MSYSPLSRGSRLADSAYVMSDNSGTPVNCNPVFDVLGKTRAQMTFTYKVGLNAGNTNGDLLVSVNGQQIPRYVAGTTLDAYYIEISNDTIEFYTDLTIYPLSIEIGKRT